MRSRECSGAVRSQRVAKGEPLPLSHVAISPHVLCLGT